MKAILQLNLDSPFNKNYYRTRKNKLEITKQNAYSQYMFDNICYQAQDTNSSIIYDIVIDYSEKNKSLNSLNSTSSINVNGQLSSRRVFDQVKQLYSSHQNISSTIIQDYKQPQFIYNIIFDQITQNKSIQQFIKQISQTQIFKKQKIKIAHFVSHQNGIYDFHKKKIHLSQTQRQQLDKQYAKFNGSIQDNFMWVYNKQINLCQEIKLSNIPHLTKTLAYITADQFNKLSQPTLGVQLASNLTKAQQIQHKQLQNKKVLEIFIINIGNKIRIALILFNYNKNYTLSAQQNKQLAQLYMMYGSMTGQIKYQTIKIQILNKLMKNSEKLYYIMYFPGPRLSVMPTMPVNSSNLNNSRIHKMSTQMIKSTFSTYLSSSKLKNQTINMNINLNTNKSDNIATMTTSKTSQFSRNNSPQKKDKQIQIINNMFTNYNSLKTKDRDSLQKIIKQYLTKKQDNLKSQLQKVKQRVKQLKLNQRIQQCQVADLKIKCTKALQKMSQSIIQLHKMGIKNVERHMDWLKIMVDQKKQYIKQTEQDIEQINKKTIQNRKSHQYFYNKMIQFRDKLKQKQIQSVKYQLKQNTPCLQSNAKSNSNEKQKGHQQQHQKTYLNYLSLAQLQQLQQHKQKLKSRMMEKLKKSSEKKQFFQALADLRNKATKIQITRLEQKYFDLLHD